MNNPINERLRPSTQHKSWQKGGKHTPKKVSASPLSRDFRGVSKVRGGRRNRFSPRGELIPAYPQGGPRTPGASRATRIQTKRNGEPDQQSQKKARKRTSNREDFFDSDPLPVRETELPLAKQVLCATPHPDPRTQAPHTCPLRTLVHLRR